MPFPKALRDMLKGWVVLAISHGLTIKKLLKLFKKKLEQ